MNHATGASSPPHVKATHFRASVHLLVWMVFCCLAPFGCTRPTSNAPNVGEDRAKVLLSHPGEEDGDETGDPATWIRRGQALEADKRPVEALMAYRNAMRMLPDDWPGDQRASLENKIARMSFLMGVPGQVDREDAATSPEVRSVSPAVEKARADFAHGRELEQAGKKEEALASYRQVLDTIDDREDSELYWNAWQRLEDLSPEGQGPAAQAAKAQAQDSPLPTIGNRPGTTAELPRPGRRFRESVADVRLVQARKAYVAGMMAVESEELTAAREAFETVLKLIDEDQDPELYRAAQVNLRTLEKPGKKPTPSPFLGY